MTERKDDPWDKDFFEPKGTAEDVTRWKELREKFIERARALGLSKSEMGRRSGIPPGTLWQWLDGTYKGVLANQNERVAKFLEALDEMGAAVARMPTVPGFFPTPTSEKLTTALIFAQTAPSMVIGVLGSGMGKTFAAEEYIRTRPVTYSVTMRPTTKSVQRMLQVIAEKLEVTERGLGNIEDAIGKKLKRNGRTPLLIVDEAQHLTDDAVNQLRYFLDVYGTGIALLGNQELYSRFGNNTPKPAYAQLASRVGMRVRQLTPVQGDMDALLDAWAIEDSKIRAELVAIGKRPGALRQMTQTLQLASIYAAGATPPREMALEDVKLAIDNRGVREA